MPMKRKIQRTAICCILICLCMALSMVSVLAADTTYVLSFRPGANGSFAAGAESYLSGFGEVQKSAAGNLFVKVQSGTAFPSNIVSYLQADEGYYYKGGLTGATVTGDLDCVAEYGVLSGSGVLYTVQYVDATTGTELAESYQGYANTGDTIAFSAKTLSGYAADSASKTISVSSGAVLQFLYSSDGSNDRTDYVYGEDTVIIQTVTTQPAETQPAEPQETTPPVETETQAETQQETSAEEIPENDVPLGEDNNGESAPAEDIVDETPPLTDSVNDSGAKTAVIVSIGAVIALLAAAATILLRKKAVRK